MYRAHSVGRGPWWFSSARPDGGRFDLPSPDGTCYVAGNLVAAVRERLGPALYAPAIVTEAFADSFVVSALRCQTALRLADTCNTKAAGFGMTREISTAGPYALTQKWAAALFAIPLQGIRYQLRMSTGQKDFGFALFGPGGERNWATDPTPVPGRAALVRLNIGVAAPPRRVRVIRPPIA